MKLDYNVDVPYVPTQEGKWVDILREFVASGEDVARVILDLNTGTGNARGYAKKVAKLHQFPVAVAVRHGELYFFRLEGKSNAVRP